ncbi:MAG TPA: ATP-grasp domain-containing protein [Anaeromyxobacteraceae bacterium]|nr:ATP-grasp domain-containing protein [Anaeromyxobacteraceae bacterium]
MSTTRDRRSRAASAVLVLTETRYLEQRQPSGLVAALRARGLTAHVVDPALDPGAVHLGGGVAVARGRSPAVLAALEHLEARGVTVVNRADAIRAVVDKAAMAERLAAAGVPGPATRVVARADVERVLSGGPFPMVLKPVHGDNSRGVVIVRDAAALRALRWEEPVALAQPYIEGDGRDLKLYVAGERVWAVRKASPLLDPDWRRAPAEIVPLDARLRELALDCGRPFGLALYGVDCVLGPGGPAVIEVNDFPNYSGIAEADEALAAVVAASVEPGSEVRP